MSFSLREVTIQHNLFDSEPNANLDAESSQGNLYYWIALDVIPSLQKRKIFTLLSHYTIEQLFNLNAEQLAKHKLKPEQINAFITPNSTHIEHCLEWQES